MWLPVLLLLVVLALAAIGRAVVLLADAWRSIKAALPAFRAGLATTNEQGVVRDAAARYEIESSKRFRIF